MRRLALLVVLVGTATCVDSPEEITGPGSTAPTFSRASAVPQDPVFQPGVVVARFVDPEQAAQVAAERGLTRLRELRMGMQVLRVPEGREQAVVDALSNDPRVIFAELSVLRTLGLPCTAGDGDCRPPSDNLFGRRWDLHNDGAVRDAAGSVLESVGLLPDADMDWLEAFDQLGSFTGSAVVGVIDTGIFGGHEDLAGRLIAQHDHFNADGIAEDDNGHGTHVSGISLALGDNATGATGVAYGPNISLVVSKGCGLVAFLGYICWSPDIADGIMWAVDNGANVINLSLGGATGSEAEQTALQYALANDVLPICAAGNDQAEVDFPGAFPECMAVSSTDWADQLASYSSWGPEVEVAAPGGDTIHAAAYDMIVSTWPTGGYAYLAGTSMAAPQVTGLAALLHALGVTGAAEKRALLRSTADDLGPAGFDSRFGDGRVNVWNAVLGALGGPPPPPPPNEAPVAAFTSSCAENSCAFTDASTDADGIVVSWSWDFGDGSSSTVQAPSHAYGAGGTYTVTLTVTDNGGLTDVAQQTVAVTDPPPNQEPTAAFTSSCTDLTCAFTDASTDPDGSIASRGWDFGDGATSTAQSPTHTYASAGDYTVTLTVTDDGGLTDTAVDTVTVTDPPPPPPNQAPTADFTYACTDLTCVFTNASTDSDGTITTWWWQFGDGATTNAPSPSHIYPSGGTYTVTLTVADNGGLTDVAQQTVTVTDPAPPPPNQAPTADFSFSCTDLVCTFTDESTDPDGTVTTWWWQFGDGATTNAPSPSHTYPAGGTYTVTLTVADDGGLTDVSQQAVTVTDPAPPPPNQAPSADFTYDCAGLTCTFTDASTDPDGSITSWWWQFGDGATTNAQNPTRTYAAGGTYTVTLTVTDNGGLTGVAERTITIASPPNEAPTANFSYVCTDLVCSFTDASSDPDGSIVAWSWSFGDGGTTNAPSPTYTYASAGTYTARLTVTDDGGLTSFAEQTVTVTDPPPPPPNEAPTAEFTSSCSDLVCSFTDASTDPDGSIVAWSWNFGDGATTNAPSPTHTYAAGGTYEVTLTVTDDGGLTGTRQHTVTVTNPPPPPPNQAPTAGFTYSCTDLVCAFTDVSSDPDGSIVAWSWNFGDGATTNAPSPTHTYAAGGTYTVTLTVTDDGGLTATAQQTITITAPPPPSNQPPVASFAYECTGLTCKFRDTSTDPDGRIRSRWWELGDGATTNAPNPQRRYRAAGTYTVRLTVTDNGGLSATTQQTITITAGG